MGIDDGLLYTEYDIMILFSLIWSVDDNNKIEMLLLLPFVVLTRERESQPYAHFVYNTRVYGI